MTSQRQKSLERITTGGCSRLLYAFTEEKKEAAEETGEAQKRLKVKISSKEKWQKDINRGKTNSRRRYAACKVTNPGIQSSYDVFKNQQDAAVPIRDLFCAVNMKEEDLEVAIKVVIVGNGAVGKSSMIQRYCKGTFTKDYKKTIGVDFLERQLEMEGEDVRLMLWDTAGQEEFDAITKAYYRGAQACVLAFSTTDRDSFDAIHSWKMKVEDECGEIPTVLVQNKIDLLDQSAVDSEEADLLSRALGCRLIRTSVKEDININSVFRYLAARCLAEIHEQEKQYNSNNGIHCMAIDAFGNPTTNGKTQTNGNGTIVLHPRKKGHRKRKNVLRSACRIL